MMHEVYAFVSSHSGEEAIVGFRGTDPPEWFPLVCTSMRLANKLRPIAQRIANESGSEVRLVRFAIRTDLEFLTPQRSHTS